MLALIGEALQKDDSQIQENTALSEASVGAVYAVILQIVQLEIIESRKNLSHEHEECSMRTLIVAAFRERFPDWEKPFPAILNLEALRGRVSRYPAADCVKMHQWEEIVEELMCQILWPGFDYEDEAEFMDIDPRLCGPLKKEREICEAYHTAIAPDPSDVQLALVRQSLCHLCRANADWTE
jgi:hypothetical protein